MAEFQEVVKQAKRMCEAYGDRCEPCKLYEKYGLCPLCAQSDDHVPMDWCTENMSEVERIIMDWAEKNPEPRYPSWKEAWKQLFPDMAEKEPPCLRYFISSARLEEFCPGMKCKTCRNKPLFADIAEKLGVKPIGGA